MAKRAANGAVSESESTPEHKRARRDNTQKSSRAKGVSDDEEYSENEGAEPNGTQALSLTQAQRDLALGDDEAFEAKYRDQVRREIEEKGAKRMQKIGEIAEYGIIEKIELVNFMCHSRTTVNFGPQINFVIGHNGSGKSAVLSGIAIALGGRSASTGRGTGLKSFIKEGESVAEVTITLKNEGLDAYRPDVYGSSIKVTRRFTDKGSSSYSIKGTKDKFKKTISSKREELTNITDHMNLQVDNPVVVLTQDTSRQFLASSKPKDKYQFFLNGTSLTQLSDEYETILESLKKTETILQSKQTVVPDLKRQFIEAQNKYREAQAAQQQHKRINDLEKEMAWAHMKRKKIQMEAVMTDHETAKRNVEKAQGVVANAETEVKAAEDEVSSASQRESAEDNAGTIEEQRRTIKEDIKAKKQKLQEVKAQISEMNNALQQCNSAIDGLTERITTEEAKLQDGRRELREKLNLDMERVQKQVKTEEANLRHVDSWQTPELSKRGEYDQITGSREKIRQDILSAQQNVQRLIDSQRNAINRFGSNLHHALQDIASHRWHGRQPLGPIGQYVELKEGRWAELMRIYLGGLMSSFAVTDARDREPLSRILQKHGNNHVNIIVGEVDLFDYSAGEPPANILTPLRVLNIKDEWVVRLLINGAYIERTCITGTRAEAQQLLDTVKGVNVVLSADLMRSQKYSDGGFFTSAMRKLRSDDRANWYFTGKDPAEAIKTEQEKLAALEQEHGNINPRLQEIETEGRAMQAKKLESNTRTKLYKLKDELGRLNDQAEEEAPASVQGLQEARKEEEERKQSIIDQFKAVAEREAALNGELKPLVQKLDDIRKQAEQTERRNLENKRRLEPLLERRLMAVKKLDHYRTKLEAAMKELDEAAQAEAIVVEEYETWHQEALTISQPMDTDRTPESIEAETEVLKKALRDRERRHGQSIEEIAQEVQSTQEALDKTREEFKAMKSFNKGLQLAMNIRLDTWHIFRRHISLRTKQQFSYPKALSGGEKSFSTICLLMSLWEALGCPIRCLDEFDVFMDQVNRHIAMQTMVQTAKASDKKQYIIITPLDVSSNIATGVRIHKMADPERGQTQLSFS
ncbi:Structural maintenance of chromosomes protein 6 [Ceratobasidium theobromae]|uniref:Structural maintenance of chromosomes protein 6 n=1 Tax=Ceratobasidium theobromae TaxID=1582974 RepID=A0A5N5QP28_9AGAM|nr:Structural maintenance of chromosomes protein 6 [Ceratobasidium theobromae]